MPELFHIAVPDDWEAAQAAGSYEVSTRGRTLAEEGYIHCSFAEQVAGTISRFYGDLVEVVVLRIDPDRLTSAVVVEDLVGNSEDFPHVYGPINLDAVTDATPVAVDDL